MSGDLSQPFEGVGDEPIQLDVEGHWCGGLIVRAAVADTGDGKLPVLVFTFASADGRGFLPPIMLGVTDPDELIELVRAATSAAAQAAES